MTEINKLIELWNARPQRAEPDNEEHLLYIFTGLLPALRNAMPRIVSLVQVPVAIPASDPPNIDLQPAPVPGPNSRSQAPIQNTADSAEVSGPTTDNAGIPASVLATTGETANAASEGQSAALKRARTTRARKSAAVPPPRPHGTVGNVMV